MLLGETLQNVALNNENAMVRPQLEEFKATLLSENSKTLSDVFPLSLTVSLSLSFSISNQHTKN